MRQPASSVVAPAVDVCSLGDAAGVGLPALWDYSPRGGGQLKVLTYNLFWWRLFDQQGAKGGAPFRLIAGSDRPQPYDVMAFQECNDGDYVLQQAGLADHYALFRGLGSDTTAICLAVHTPTWEVRAHGAAVVGDDGPEEYYGQRAAQWARLARRGGGPSTFVMNHHGPTPLDSGGRCGGEVTAHKLLALIQAHAEYGDAVVLLGDFNAGLASETQRSLGQRLSRVYQGSVFGGIDEIYTNIRAAPVAERNLGRGGSDHDALAAVLPL